MRIAFRLSVVLASFWVLPVFSQETIVVRPKVIDGVLVNPGIGFMTFQRFNGDKLNEGTRWTEGYPIVAQKFDGNLENEGYPMTSLAYFRVYWKFIEPAKGEYRWELIDKALETAAARGQTLLLRIAPYGTGADNDVPDWYRAMAGKEEGLPDKWRTNPEDPRYVKYFGDLVRALGARYDGHPALESVDLSIVGAWGEGAGSEQLTQKTREALVDSYLAAFKKTLLVMLLTDEKTNRYGLSKRDVGWRVDCLGDMGGFSKTWCHMCDYYPEAIINFGMQDAWKKAPVTLEVCWVIQHWKDQGWDIDYIIEQSLKWHISSFNAKSSPVPQEWLPQVERWLKKMGYRFALRKFTYPSTVKPGGEMRFTSWWENQGVAPCYRPFRLALRLSNAQSNAILVTGADLRSWLPGDNLYDNTVAVPKGLAGGDYELMVGVLDERIDEPRVKLAIEGRREDGWYNLGKIKVQQPAADPNWFALEPVKDSFGPTILDCSRWVEAPTGKHGFLTVKGDRFVFEDGTPARFWGAQVGGFSKEQTDYAVRRMRRQGINVTRMHGLENLNDRAGKTSFDYSAQGFDRLDYLISRLGENGIYMILDVHYPLTYRFKAGDEIPGLPEGGSASHAQFFNEKIAGIMRRRMTDVFTHLNPYTKKRYCDNPTIAMVEVLNEDSLFWGEIAQPFRQELEGKFADWLRKKYGDSAGLAKAWTVDGRSPLADGEGLGPGQRVSLLSNPQLAGRYFQANPEKGVRGQDQMRFYLELEDKYWADSVAAMRKAGVKVPICATNWQAHGFATRVHMLGQSRLDYIDRHGYWDHPQGEGNLKWRIATALFHNLPMIKAVNREQDTLNYLGKGNLVIEKAWEQVLGLPMTISEWNTCLPNQHSLEGTGLMAAYGLLQGWDGSLEFGYFSPDWRDTLGPGSFDMFSNPPQILQFPAVAAMWYRQDVREAEVVAESLYDPQTVFGLNEDRKPVSIAAALIGKVGYRFVPQSREPVVKDIRPYWDAEKLIARSITGELIWDASVGCVTVDTPRTQAVIGFFGAAPHELAATTLRSPTDFGAVYVTAMDGDASVRSARHILVTAVGPARNTGMEYETTSQRSSLGTPYWRLREVGKAPALLEAVTGRVEIRSNLTGRLKAWALDIVGNRTREVPLTTESNAILLNMKADYKTVYYELSTE